jgi:uncharacterized membrane protein
MKNIKADVNKIKGYLPHREVEKKPGTVTRALYDLGLGVWFGGSLFGILAMNPAVEVLDDPEERGKMVDEGWARFQPYGAAGLFTALVTHFIMRRRPPRKPSSTYKTVALVKDALMLGACVSSVASLALGEYAVDDYQPVESATEGTEETPDDVQKAQGGLSIASWAQLACGAGLIIAGAILASERDKS